MNSPFIAYGLLLDRLRATLVLPDNQIRACSNEEWALKNALANSVNVVFFDEQPVENSTRLHGGKQQLVELWFLVISTTRNVSDAGVSSLEEATALRLQVSQTLQGHQLSVDYTALISRKSQRRYTVRGEYVHYPLMLVCRTLI